MANFRQFLKLWAKLWKQNGAFDQPSDRTLWALILYESVRESVKIATPQPGENAIKHFAFDRLFSYTF